MASQLAHHWHLVVSTPRHRQLVRAPSIDRVGPPLSNSQTPMDPQDIIDDIARIAGICYPGLSAIVSGYTVDSQHEVGPRVSPRSTTTQLLPAATAHLLSPVQPSRDFNSRTAGVHIRVVCCPSGAAQCGQRFSRCWGQWRLCFPGHGFEFNWGVVLFNDLHERNIAN